MHSIFRRAAALLLLAPPSRLTSFFLFFSCQGHNQPKKAKPKYVNFLTRMADGSAVDMLPGRHFCECLAARHKLVNNCLQCGRIVCEQEGMGPCMNCGSLVVTRETQELLRRNSVQARKFLDKLMRDCGVDSGIDPDVFRQSAIQLCTSATAESLARANLQRWVAVSVNGSSNFLEVRAPPLCVHVPRLHHAQRTLARI